MTEGQPKGEESLLFKTLVWTFGIFEYCSSLPCLEYCAYRGEGPGASSCLAPDNRYWCVEMCPLREWTICCAQTDGAMFISDTFGDRVHRMGQRTMRTAWPDNGADPLRIELQSESLNYNLSMIVDTENVRRKQQDKMMFSQSDELWQLLMVQPVGGDALLSGGGSIWIFGWVVWRISFVSRRFSDKELLHQLKITPVTEIYEYKNW